MARTSIAAESLLTARSPHGMPVYFNALLGHRRHFQTQSKSARFSSATRKQARGATISHSRCQNLGMQKGEGVNSLANSSQKYIPNLRKVLAAMGVTTIGFFISVNPARAQGVFNYLTGPLYEPIRNDVPYWLRSLVWNDFRLSVLIFVATPLVIWLWSLLEQKGTQDAVKRIMFGYWQGASLLMFTVYLQIGAQPISFATAAAVQVIIPFTLWWWKDLSQEVAEDKSTLAKVFKIWRIIATVLAVLGAITQLLTTQTACAFLPSPAAVLDTPGCAAWLEPPLKFKDIFHPNIAAEHLQVFGQLGALFFVANFLLYLATSLPKAGRLARSNKTLSYQVLAKLGFYSS